MNFSRGTRTLTFVAMALLSLGVPGFGIAGQLEGDTQPKLNGTTLVREL